MSNLPSRSRLAEIQCSAWAAYGPLGYLVNGTQKRQRMPKAGKQPKVEDAHPLRYVENFRRQYQHFFPKRRALLLTPLNEHGVPKFVCTTVIPSAIPHPAFLDWQGSARLLADLCLYDPPSLPHQLPTTVKSPVQLLKDRRGNSFEWNAFLVSILLGSCYNAYVVSGYATKEVATQDRSSFSSDFAFEARDEVGKRGEKEEVLRYAVKPRPEFLSEYEEEMRRREREEKQGGIDEGESTMGETKEREHEGWVHSWVLVLPRANQMEGTSDGKPFFIEATLGEKRDVSHPGYLGIESLWNNNSYYVNLQERLQAENFDFQDRQQWLCVQCPLGTQSENMASQSLYLSLSDMETPYPGQRKMERYGEFLVERTGPYVEKDGLVYRRAKQDTDGNEDKESKSDQEKMVVKKYLHRSDRLYEEVQDLTTGWITHRFQDRPDGLLEHSWAEANFEDGLGASHRVKYMEGGREDGLWERSSSTSPQGKHVFTDSFSGRPNHLLRRQASFHLPLPSNSLSTSHFKGMTEEYDEGEGEKWSRVTYDLENSKIRVEYHREREKISQSTTEFLVPSPDERGRLEEFSMDNVHHYSVQGNKEGLTGRRLEFCQLLERLWDRQKAGIEATCRSHAEMKEFLATREKEKKSLCLTFSPFDRLHNQTLRDFRLRKEQEERDQSAGKDVANDPLRPYLMQLKKNWDDGVKLEREQALELCAGYLADIRRRITDRANFLQSQLDKKMEEMQNMERNYQAHLGQMSESDEHNIQKSMNEVGVSVRVLEARLRELQVSAPEIFQREQGRVHSYPFPSHLHNMSM
ncbi:unnamed protein product [Darwinula stevensoni]|uniref:Uncharacterized protein n=1 Tax=Darwinula stevensoni TaxID=69355 RepID=A0A7R9A468_9CRUS|nr:unnamed protein product [Darwinula stevensoni]CAG0883693.1 unnamed protein product [Darwinula stevensoni]